MQPRLAPLAAWNAVAWAATAAYGFVVAAVVFRYAGAGAFGIWATIAALRGFLLLADSGLAMGISRDVALAQSGAGAGAAGDSGGRMRAAARLYAGLGAL